MSQLKVDDIINVVVSAAGAATPRDGFNVGLILGQSAHISTTDRCKVYGDLDAMLDDGFLETEAEYKAAQLYFAQNPAPQKVIVGVRDAGDGEEETGETWVEALTACKAVNGEWYGVYIAAATALTAAEHQAVATYVETNVAAYFYDDSNAADIGTGTTDVFSLLKAQGFKRSLGLYSAQRYAGAAAMGFAMGANNGTQNSAYTMAYKQLVGVTPDDLSATSVANLRGKNANYYVKRGPYIVLETGVVASGAWFDEIIGLDQLSNDIQLGCMDVLTGTPTKIPYTDAGAMQFVLACNEACENALRRGFLTAGTWDGNPVLGLETGDTLESGYFCQAEPVAEQSSAQRAGRICPPVYVCVRLAGAIHSATIRVMVA